MKFLHTRSGHYPFAEVDSERVLKMANETIEADKSFQLESFVRGHHVYRTSWTPSLSEIIACEKGTYKWIRSFCCGGSEGQERSWDMHRERWVKLLPSIWDMMGIFTSVKSQSKGWTMGLVRKLLVTDHWLHTMYGSRYTQCCIIQFAIFGTGINGCITHYAGTILTRK